MVAGRQLIREALCEVHMYKFMAYEKSFASIELKRMTDALSRRFSGLKCENGLLILNLPKTWWKRGWFKGKMVLKKGQ